MIRPSRLILGSVLVMIAACSATPTAPEAPASMAPEALAPSFDDTSECRSGWSVPNGKSCDE